MRTATRSSVDASSRRENFGKPSRKNGIGESAGPPPVGCHWVLTHADLTNREAALTGGDLDSPKSRVRAWFYRSVIEAMAGASGRVEQRWSLGNVAADLRDAASAILQEDGIDPDAPVPIDPDTLQRRQGGGGPSDA